MFDDEDAVSLFDKSVEDVEKLLDIGEVESSSWFIEYIESLSCRSLGEVEGELDTLRLSS